MHLLGDLLLLHGDDDELSDRLDDLLRDNFDGTRHSSRLATENTAWDVEFSSICREEDGETISRAKGWKEEGGEEDERWKS